MLNIQKLSSPGTSKSMDYIVNLYKDGTFRVAYRYKGWTEDAVKNEIKIIETRYPDYNGYTIEW